MVSEAIRVKMVTTLNFLFFNRYEDRKPNGTKSIMLPITFLMNFGEPILYLNISNNKIPFYWQLIIL